MKYAEIPDEFYSSQLEPISTRQLKHTDLQQIHMYREYTRILFLLFADTLYRINFNYFEEI